MTNLSITISIWWKAIILNALFTGIWGAFEAGAFVLVIMLLMVVFGFMVTLPLLPFIMLLLKLQGSLPYGKTERITWLYFTLVILVWGFYVTVAVLFDKHLPSGDNVFFYAIGTTTSAAVLAAVYLTRKEISGLSRPCSDDDIINHKSITYV